MIKDKINNKNRVATNAKGVLMKASYFSASDLRPFSVVLRNMAVLAVRKNRSFVSTVFFTEKQEIILRIQRWVDSDLVRQCELGIDIMDPDICPLYYRAECIHPVNAKRGG